MPHARMSSPPPPVFFRKVRRRSSLFYSQSADDIASSGAGETVGDSSASLSSAIPSLDPSPLLSSPTLTSKRDPIVPLCPKCRTSALSASAVLPSTPESYSGKSFPSSPDVTPATHSFKGHFEHTYPLTDHSDSVLSSPPTRSRRKSSHREPFAGSYEESLLSGRVAAVSCSPPVPFQVRIGVLGKAKYTGQCPPHITTSVDAVFYDWKNSVFDSIGVVSSIFSPLGTPSSPSSSSLSADAERGSPYVGTADLNEVYKLRYGPNSKKFPGYHIPRQGQIQIVLSNLQKTAVHFFLIPYDLRKMPSGTKTFIRQKVYEQQPKKLIHAIHLQIACPNRNRLYLYGDVRLVFQNREVMATSGVIPVKTKAETFSGEFAKWVTPVIATASLTRSDPELCSRCADVIETEHGGIETAQDPIPGKLELEEEEHSGARPMVTRIASREELDSRMMEDINASFKLL